MRILHVHKYAHEHDGVGRYIRDARTLMERRGHTTALLAMEDAHSVHDAWSAYAIPSHATEHLGSYADRLGHIATAWWNARAYHATKRLLAAYRPDVLHAHNLYTHLSPSVLAAAHEEGVPVVLTCHDYGYLSANYAWFDGSEPLPPHPSLQQVAQSRWIKGSYVATGVLEILVRIQRMLGLWTRGVTHMLTASQYMAQCYRDAYPRTHIEALSLPSGVLIQAPELASSEPRHAPYVLFVGRFEKNKGSDLVADLACRMPHVRFMAIGQRPGERGGFTHPPKNLEILPVLPAKKVWGFMREASAVLVPSRTAEPFGLTALEALSLGTPVITSGRGGLQEIVTPGVGYVCSPHRPEIWEEAISSLLWTSEQDTQRLSRLRDACRKRARELGDPQYHADQLERIYNESVKSRKK